MIVPFYPFHFLTLKLPKSIFSIKTPKQKNGKISYKDFDSLLSYWIFFFFLEIPNKIALLVALVLHHSARKICTIQFPKSFYCP